MDLSFIQVAWPPTDPSHPNQHAYDSMQLWLIMLISKSSTGEYKLTHVIQKLVVFMC